VPKDTVLGIAQQVSESLIVKINAERQTDTISPSSPPRKWKNNALYENLLPRKLGHLSLEDRLHIEPILIKDAHVFHDVDENDFK